MSMNAILAALGGATVAVAATIVASRVTKLVKNELERKRSLEYLAGIPVGEHLASTKLFVNDAQLVIMVGSPTGCHLCRT